VNTAVARRLAFGDRVVWVGKDGYQPSGLGTITRITAHEVEVSWDDERAVRYRRAQLHNLRHAERIVPRVAYFGDLMRGEEVSYAERREPGALA
jgi:hypothetical protein